MENLPLTSKRPEFRPGAAGLCRTVSRGVQAATRQGFVPPRVPCWGSSTRGSSQRLAGAGGVSTNEKGAETPERRRARGLWFSLLCCLMVKFFSGENFIFNPVGFHK